MKKLQEKDVLKEYKLFKEHAEHLYTKKLYNDCLNYVVLCSKIAYTFNFIYTDDFLEDILNKIGDVVLEQREIVSKSGKYVLYDYFGLDSRGLTQQYLRALIYLEKEFLYILDGEGVVSQSNDILNELKSYDKATVHILGNTNYIDKIREVHEVIASYQPEVALLHFSPWDVVGVTFWNKYRIRRFLINLTDHAFWLGVHCADYFLEFRQFGMKLSTEARRIAKEKLLLLPYYPIQKEGKFLGFPVDVKDRIIGFSGASFYKIYGKEGIFLKLIKRVLEENQNFIFFFAGSGVSAPLKKFIKDNSFEERFILLGNRTDINEVFKNIDIYVNTFPVIGALMTQFAVVNGKALVTYTSPDLACNFIEDFLRVDKKKVKSMFTEDEFVNELNLLIRSSDYRTNNANNYKGSVPTVLEFNKQLGMLLTSDSFPKVEVEDIRIDYEAVKKLYLEVENDFVNSYDFMKLLQLKYDYFLAFPFSASKSLIRVINFKGDLILNKIFKELGVKLSVNN